MNIFMIGGTGLLGSYTAFELIHRGHKVISLSLSGDAPKDTIPSEMVIIKGNYLTMTDEEIIKMFNGCDSFIFAAGVDERVEGAPPVYDMYKKYNIDSVDRLLRLAKLAGVKHSVVFGSYFAYFAKKYPEMKLTDYHPYIKSRIDQEEVALSYADDNFDVAVLELPYIFGTQKGRKPVWTFLVETAQQFWPFTFYSRGGSTMVTVKQVAQAACGALERNTKGNCYPIGYYNKDWNQLFYYVHKCLTVPYKKVIPVPKALYKIAGKKIMQKQKAKGIEGGLNMVKFAELQYKKLYIDKSQGCDFLGVTEDNIDQAIMDSINQCIDIQKNKLSVKQMRGE